MGPGGLVQSLSQKLYLRMSRRVPRFGSTARVHDRGHSILLERALEEPSRSEGGIYQDPDK